MVKNAVHICCGVRKNCYAMHWSYGHICVGCGCCSKDKEVRAKARLHYHEELIKENDQFDRWAEDAATRRIQERNIRSNRRFHRRRVRDLKALLKKYRPVSVESHDAPSPAPEAEAEALLRRTAGLLDRIEWFFDGESANCPACGMEECDGHIDERANEDHGGICELLRLKEDIEVAFPKK